MSWKSRSQILQCACAIGVAILVITNYANRKSATSSNSGPISAVSHHLSHDVAFLRQKSEEETGYIIALSYGEGYHGRGSAGLINLQCWVQSFNLSMHVVEPMISDSY